MDAFPSSSADAPSPSGFRPSPSWPELVEEEQPPFFGPSWQDAPVMMTTTEDAVACEPVEFEDLFANSIAQGSNLEFRVSKVGSQEAVVDVDGNKNAVVMNSEGVEAVGEKEGVVEKDVVTEDASDDVDKLEEDPEGRVALQKLELHRNSLHAHVEELHRVVSLQCRLTGVNPLDQELAFAVLGNNEGRQDYNLSAEALRYLKDVFAIKDTFTKSEYRYISRNCGATQTQVREFFALQKSRVKAFIQQCSDEAKPHISYHIVEGRPDLEHDLSFTKLTDVDSVELLLQTMRQELYFTQQEKLLQIILQTEPGLILRRFLEKGGLKVLCAWLITAAADEQTSVLRLLLHVLSHLPMSCAIPLQVSALIQPVNRLRFYFVQDVASDASSLMSKWSSLFMRRVESGSSMDSPGLGPASKDSLAVRQRVQKRERDPGLIFKNIEGGLSKKAVRSLLPGEAMKLSSGSAPAAEGQFSESKPDLKSKTMIMELPNSNASKPKALAAAQRNFRKIVPRKGVPQAQTETKPRLPENAVVDETGTNQALDIEGNNLVSSTSTSTQAPKARADDELKVAAKVTVAMSTSRSSNAFPVSDAANIATPVSRKHSLSDHLKGRRKVLPVEDLGNGNRWREPTARRPVIEVGKTSRPLSADEIRKAKLRARLMQLPTSGSSGNKSVSAPELYSSRGKPTPVGDGWSLDRYASMDGGDKPTQVGVGVSLLRPAASNVDVTSAPSQILDEKTFDLLLAEQASEAHVPGIEQARNTHRSPFYVDTLEKGAESTSHMHDTTFLGSDSNLGQDASIKLNDVGINPLSPSIAVAISENPINVGSEVAEDIGAINDPENVVPKDLVNVSTAADSLMDYVPEESRGLDVTAPENVPSKGIEAHSVPWVVPSVFNLNPAWGVVAGDASKELGFQAARVKREEEVVYSDAFPVPDNPKDLWDEEPLYDDTLTLEISVEVLDYTSSKASSPRAVVNQGAEFNPLTNGNAKILGEPNVSSSNTFAAQQQSGDAAPGHDPNLLALLLSNPHLVSQLASQQKGDSGMADLSALLALENGGFPSATREVLLQTTNFPAQMQQQPRDEIVKTGNFQGGQPLSASACHHPFSEHNAEPMRVVEDSKAAALVPSWDVVHSDWGLPTPMPPPPPPPPPPPSAAAALAMPSHQAATNTSNLSPPPPPGSGPSQEFASSPAAAYNGSFQKLPSSAPYTWAPLNTLMHCTPKLQFESPPLGRGRPPPPVVSHNVNGPSAGMMPDHVVDDAATTTTVSSSSFNQAAPPAPAPHFNPVGWPPHGINVPAVNHHTVANAGNATSSSWNAFNPSDFQHQHQQQQQQQQQQRLPDPPSSWRPASPLPPPPPLPSFLAQNASNNRYWQPAPPPPPPPHVAPAHSFRPQDCRPHHPPAAAASAAPAPWHLNGSNYGSNR